MRHFIIGILSCCLLLGCDLIQYHPYDVRLSGTLNINAANVAKIEEACADKDTLRFALMGDSQRWYNETKDFVTHINQRTDIDFVIHGGDISDFGVTKEFLWQRDIMNQLRMPYVCLLGNHDCIGTGKETFQQVFGTPNFSFIAGRVKFVCLNTNALDHDYSVPIPDLSFMEREASSRSDAFDKTVICMHARPYSDVFNNNVAVAFKHYTHLFRDLQFCTAAHNHAFSDETLFDDGVHYIVSDAMKNRNYLVFTLTPSGYEYERIFY